MKNLRNKPHPDLHDSNESKDQKSVLIKQSACITVCKKCNANMQVMLKQNSIIWKCPVESCQHSFEEKQDK